jgi:hypothetical protein
MLKQPTVLVLGAGASQEVKMPTGSELTEEIAKIVSDNYDMRFEGGDRRFGDALAQKLASKGIRDLTPYVDAGRLIKRGMAQSLSIDNFIHIHRENPAIELCGKTAIATAILKAERDCKMYIRPDGVHRGLDFSDELVNKSWFNGFIKLLTEYSKVDELADKLRHLTLIVFNYDRCIEHFLFHSFMNVYGVDKPTALDLISRITIYHPYGTLGPLLWTKQPGAIDFGADPHGVTICGAADRLKTFTEGTDPGSEELVAVREAIQEARTIVFLGFAFHPLNLKLIFGEPQSRRVDPLRVRGTAKNLSEEDTEIVTSELARYLGVHNQTVQLDKDATCALLLARYWRSLATS